MSHLCPYCKKHEYPDARHLNRCSAERAEARHIKNRLAYLRREIKAERISYGEIAELQDLVKYIDPGDVLLLQWAGVPEFPEGES